MLIFDYLFTFTSLIYLFFDFLLCTNKISTFIFPKFRVICVLVSSNKRKFSIHKEHSPLLCRCKELISFC